MFLVARCVLNLSHLLSIFCFFLSPTFFCGRCNFVHGFSRNPAMQRPTTPTKPATAMRNPTRRLRIATTQRYFFWTTKRDVKGGEVSFLWENQNGEYGGKYLKTCRKTIVLETHSLSLSLSCSRWTAFAARLVLGTRSRGQTHPAVWSRTHPSSKPRPKPTKYRHRCRRRRSSINKKAMRWKFHEKKHATKTKSQKNPNNVFLSAHFFQQQKRRGRWFFFQHKKVCGFILLHAVQIWWSKNDLWTPFACDVLFFYNPAKGHASNT